MASGESFFISYCKQVKVSGSTTTWIHQPTWICDRPTFAICKTMTKHTTYIPSLLYVWQCSCKYSEHLYDIRNSPAFNSRSAGRDIVRFHDPLSDMTNSICIHRSIWNFPFAKFQLSTYLCRIRPETFPFFQSPNHCSKGRVKESYFISTSAATIFCRFSLLLYLHYPVIMN